MKCLPVLLILLASCNNLRNYQAMLRQRGFYEKTISKSAIIEDKTKDNKFNGLIAVSDGDTIEVRKSRIVREYDSYLIVLVIDQKALLRQELMKLKAELDILGYQKDNSLQLEIEKEIQRLYE